MKIDFLKPYSSNNTTGNYHNIRPAKPLYPQMQELSNVYYIPFKGAETSLEEQFENLKNIHCPCCGTKMITEEEFQKILREAENIETTEDFVSILKNNIEYVNKRFAGTVNIIIKIAKNNPDIPISGIVAMAKAGTNKNLDNVIKSQAEFIKNYPCENISESDMEIMKEYSDRLLKMQEERKNGDLKIRQNEILKDTILRMESPEKHTIYQNLRTSFVKAYEKRAVLSNLDANGKSPEYNLISNIFSQSVSKLNTISPYGESNSIVNKILLCGKCTHQKEGSMKKIIKNPDNEQLENYNRYLEDIASEILSEKTDITASYVINLNSKMKRLSRGNLYIKNAPSISNLKHDNFVKITESINSFNLTEIDGIPCAGCGKDTITHAKKLEIFEQINNTETNRELVEILKANENIIREKFMPITKEFIRLVEENPNITDEELISNLQHFTSEHIKSTLASNIQYVKYVLNNKPLNISDRKILNEYIKTVNEYFIKQPENGKFNWYKYKAFLDKTVNKMECHYKRYIYDKLKYDIKDELSEEYAVYPVDTVVEKLNSPTKVIVQNIIRESVATKDHVIAKKKAGTNDKENLIVLCKCCNQSKGSADFYNWLMRNKYAEKNLSNYFRAINEKIKNGEIEPEYKDYLKELQINLFEISKGQFDVDYSHNS